MLRRRGRLEPAVWISAATAALLLTMSVSGTLSSWTQAIVTHDGNTIGTGGGAVALRVAGPSSSSCLSTTDPSNAVTCAINLYGSAGSTVSSLQPGQTVTTTVTLTNQGDLDASTLAFAPGACTGSTPLCSNLLVSMTCTGAATKLVTASTMDSFATADSTFTGSLQSAGADSSVCVFALTLPLTAPITTRSQTLQQEVVWTLGA